MLIEVSDIREFLNQALRDAPGQFKYKENSAEGLEATGTIEAMQGKKKVDGMYFASVVPKPKDCRLYFFPIYTHPDQFDKLSPSLRKMLKGKSCFHMKKLDDEVQQEIQSMINKGAEVFAKDGLILPR